MLTVRAEHTVCRESAPRVQEIKIEWTVSFDERVESTDDVLDAAAARLADLIDEYLSLGALWDLIALQAYELKVFTLDLDSRQPNREIAHEHTILARQVYVKID